MSPSYDFPTEVFLHIGLYLDRQQLVNSALVSRSWNAVFEPLVWSHLEIGSEKAISRIKVEDIRSKAPWIRSLAFKDCQSAVQYYSIGKGCTHLQSLTLPIIRSKEAVERGYWKTCKDLVKQNKATLVSLSLTFVPLTTSNWDPLLSISQYPHSTLRCLRLEDCKLPYRHLAAFWDVCERLEVLELHRVPFEPPYSYKVHEKAFGPKERQGWKVPFSNLLELILDCSGPKNSLTQLEVVVRGAPKLKKLCWNIDEGAWFPIIRFMYLFSAQEEYHHAPEPQSVRHCVPLAVCSAPCWPNLESLVMRMREYKPLHFLHEDYLIIVNMSKQLRVLDLPWSVMTSGILEPLLRLHSSTLTEIDLQRTFVYQSDGILSGLFSSCPRLARVRIPFVSAEEFIKSDGHWECCDQLEEFRVSIRTVRNLSQPEMMDQEIQDMSKAVFKQLGRLCKLKILDLSDDRNNPGWPLQFTESMGLASLSSLTELETLVLQGDQNMIPGDVSWMLEHWKSLKVIGGGMFAAQHYGRDCTLATMFNKRGIRTPRSVYPDGYLSNFGKVSWDEDRVC